MLHHSNSSHASAKILQSQNEFFVSVTQGYDVLLRPTGSSHETAISSSQDNEH